MRLRVAHRRSTPQRRRGIALADAIVGGIILGIALTAIISVATRSLDMQADGEKRLTASWLADELLSMVLVEQPDEYPLMYDTEGRFAPPFDAFTYDVDIEELGRGLPYHVSVEVHWSGRSRDAVRVESYIALRVLRQDEPEPLREPFEPVDRDARYFEDELEGE